MEGSREDVLLKVTLHLFQLLSKLPSPGFEVRITGIPLGSSLQPCQSTTYGLRFNNSSSFSAMVFFASNHLTIGCQQKPSFNFPCYTNSARSSDLDSFTDLSSARTTESSLSFPLVTSCAANSLFKWLDMRTSD